jgi:Putative collagen-binding domain of a collagenase
MLVESRPYQVRVPDQMLVLNRTPDPINQPMGARADDDDLGGDCGSYAFVYSPDGGPVTVDLTRLSGSMVVATWFDPRSGRGRWLGQFPVRGSRVFTPPSVGDWVLVLDDASRNYPPVGLGSDRGMSI